ncbi:MAG: nitroreductase family deazaflavin-dependent oxidoreductase [Chloroflexia bacterium]|nr:nitroreductase family deazaflavin-dependent oxidoreductase [Chloroflexia bacterium]
MFSWFLPFEIAPPAWSAGRAARERTHPGVTISGIASGIGRSTPVRARTTLKAVGTLHRLVYQWSGGRLGGTLHGRPVLLLTTAGRKTGRERTWPLCYVAAGDEFILVASAGGDAFHPSWYLNLRTNPHVLIQLGDRTRPMIAHTARGAERARLWRHLVRRFPVLVGYQRKTNREIPVVILRPATRRAVPARGQRVPRDDSRDRLPLIYPPRGSIEHLVHRAWAWPLPRLPP